MIIEQLKLSNPISPNFDSFDPETGRGTAYDATDRTIREVELKGWLMTVIDDEYGRPEAVTAVITIGPPGGPRYHVVLTPDFEIGKIVERK